MGEPPEILNLFVYGTLRAGAGSEWSRYLARQSVLVGFGQTPGLLFQIGSYPGMKISEDGQSAVRGEVYRVCGLSVLEALDRYEGCGPADPPPREFERRTISVQLDDGRTVEAWAYVYCLETEGRPRIDSGDYRGTL